MLMDYQIPQTTETKVLDFNKRDPDTSLNCKNIKSEANIEENYLTSETYNNVSTLDNADNTLLISNSYCLDINNQNIKPGINTVFSPDYQNIKATEDEENFKYCVDVENVNNNYNLPEITINAFLLNNSFKQTDSVQSKIQTEFETETYQYEMYDENIKKLDITDHINGYNSMSDIVDLDEFKQFLDFDRSNDTAFIDNIKDVEDEIESFRIKNDLTLVNEENDQKLILNNTISKDSEQQMISNTNDELTENNLQKTVYDKKRIISISSESDDELNDLKLTLSFTDLETVSLSSLEEQIDTGYINNNAVIENTTKDVLTIPLDDKLKTFDHAVNEDANDSAVENSNSNKALVTFDDSDSCSGYNSSGFEFITEDEANETKFNELTSKDTCKTIKISPDTNSSESQKTKEVAAAKRVGNSSIRYDYRNAATRYYNHNISKQNINDYSYRQNHVLPEGDSYLHLFEGMFAPTVTRMMENKIAESSSIYSYVQYEGIGFDMRAVKDQDSDEEFEGEAKQSASKILSIYPSENRKRRHH